MDFAIIQPVNGIQLNMSDNKVDATDGDFAVTDNKVILINDDDSWCNDFYITIKGKRIHWRLTLARLHYVCVVYLTFISDSRNPNSEEINVKYDLYISLGACNCIDRNSTVKVSAANIHRRLERVWIHALKSKTTTDFYFFSIEIRGRISEVNDLQNFPVNIETIPTNVLKNFENFFIEEQFCDVTFQTADSRISAHKNILAAQSPVFKRMFSSDMLEKTPGAVINLENIEGVVLKEMLRFIYGGRVENIEKMADKLLILADKYDIQSLTTLCEKVLYDQLTTSNAISTMKIAELHNAKILRRLTEEFIIKNKKHLLQTAEFKTLMITNPEIVSDILKAN